MKPKTIAAAKFKAECLRLLDEVARSRTELVITKRGQPVARVVPLERKKALRERGKIVGDIVHFAEPEWIR